MHPTHQFVLLNYNLKWFTVDDPWPRHFQQWLARAFNSHCSIIHLQLAVTWLSGFAGFCLGGRPMKLAGMEPRNSCSIVVLAALCYFLSWLGPWNFVGMPRTCIGRRDACNAPQRATTPKMTYQSGTLQSNDWDNWDDEDSDYDTWIADHWAGDDDDESGGYGIDWDGVDDFLLDMDDPEELAEFPLMWNSGFLEHKNINIVATLRDTARMRSCQNRCCIWNRSPGSETHKIWMLHNLLHGFMLWKVHTDANPRWWNPRSLFNPCNYYLVLEWHMIPPTDVERVCVNFVCSQGPTFLIVTLFCWKPVLGNPSLFELTWIQSIIPPQIAHGSFGKDTNLLLLRSLLGLRWQSDGWAENAVAPGGMLIVELDWDVVPMEMGMS